MKRGFIESVFVLLVLLLAIVVAETVETGANVQNSAPVLEVDIPNFTWAANVNLTAAFILTDHFVDYNGDEMNFTFLPDPLNNISVIINESTFEVSFYPDVNFTGTRNLTFYASDQVGNASSNVVYLNVGTDFEAPKWFNATKSASSINQNDLIDFSTIWTDDSQLASYVFSVDQGSGWYNFSALPLTGISDTSSYFLQISAAPGSTAYWRFYAWDTTGNMNVTDIQNFTVNTIDVVTPPPSGSSSGSSSSSSSSSGGGGSSGSSGGSGAFERILEELGISIPKEVDFEFDITDFEVEVLQGEEKSIFFKIKNTGTTSLNFNLTLKGLEDYLRLDEDKFTISPGAEKGVLLEIDIPDDFFPGQYFSYLNVAAGGIEKTIPIVITVKPNNPALDLQLTILDELVNPGNEVSFTLDLYQLEFEEDIKGILYVAVKDFTGKVYSVLDDEIYLEDYLQLNRTLFVPENTPEGNYLVYARLEYEKSVALDSESFEVGYRNLFQAFFKYGSFFFIFLLLAIFFVLLFMRYERNKRKEKLLLLYVLLSKLKKRLGENDLAGAAEIYISIKTKYGEHVPLELIRDKEFLKKELVRLSKVVQSSIKVIEDEEKSADDETKDSEKTKDSKNEEDSKKEEGKDEDK